MNVVLSFLYSLVAAIIFIVVIRFIVYVSNASPAGDLPGFLSFCSSLIWIGGGFVIMMYAGQEKMNLVDFWKKKAK